MPAGLDDASADYARRQGPLCARIRATPFQGTVACLLAVLAATPLLVSPQALWVTVSVIIALVSAAPLGLRLLAATIACHRDPTLVITAETIAALDRTTLPTYTVLVPLYREAEVVDDLLAALDALDYPRDRLDIQILVEHDDDITTTALATRTLPAHVRITTAPPGQPRTKPRACNVGLARSSADLLVIFDAEDRPEPDQLLKAVAAYRALPPEVVCLQGRLDHYNSRQSLCARWTAIDYLLWFRLVMPGLQRLGAPLPLGGTSNHFRVDALRKLGGWDPFNVTEDCDLGLRIARRGWTTRMLATTTWEEAVASPRAWIRQRSRWLKGYCQTWLVHSRPVRGRSGFRPWEFACLSLNTIGLIAALVVNPVAWIVLALWLIVGWSVVDPRDPLSVATLVIGAAGLAANALVVVGAAWACRRLGRHDLFAAALLSPVAWALQSLAAWQACWEMVARPFHWQKTVHGQAVEDGAAPMRSGGYRLAAVAAVLILVIAGLAAWRVADDLATQERARLGEIPRQLAWPALSGEATSLIDTSPRPRPAPWRTATGDGRPDRGIEGPALAADVAFPDATLDLVNGRRRDWSSMAVLACDLHVATDAPRHLRVAAHLRDGDLRWFQNESPQRLIPGTWTAVAFDLRDASQWTAVDHLRDFSADLLGELREVGLHVRGHEDWQGTVTVANLRVIAAPATAPRLEIRSAPTTATRMQAWDLVFTLSKAWSNPFDPDVVAVDARIRQPDGNEVVVPAFLDQAYRRNRTGDGERLEAVDAPFWHLRWRPRQAGAHRWSLELREDGGEPRILASGDLAVTDAAARGYLTRSAAKPDLFAWEDGSFFYPIGQNLCQAVDHVPPVKRWSFPQPTDEGTFTFDRYFARMAAAGMNTARVWMTPWSHGIEGRADWEGFRGAGRYNLAQAWKVDRLLDEGERLDIGVILTLHHMSEFNSAWLSRAWADSALNAIHGGPLHDPEDFYTDAEVRRLYHQRVRYLVARWGSHPALLAWELFGEANLMPGCDFGGPVPESCVAWHRDLEQRIRALDHGRHLVFTHCHNWQAGHELWKLDGIDCVQGNGYIRPPNTSNDHVVNFDRYLAEVTHYRKPVLVAEFGGRSELGAPSEDYLVGQLHSGIWASFVRPFAGAALHWWWNLVDGRDLYPHYAGLARFAQGIDRLQRDYRPVRVDVSSSRLQAAGMQDGRGGFYWVYDPGMFTAWEELTPEPGGILRLRGLPPGRYRLERWDTLTGLLGSEDVAIGDQGLDLALPTIHRDLALRLELVP